MQTRIPITAFVEAEMSQGERAEIFAVYYRIGVFDDSDDGIERPRDSGCECYIVPDESLESIQLSINEL